MDDEKKHLNTQLPLWIEYDTKELFWMCSVFNIHEHKAVRIEFRNHS
jgi:hypothetical protein